MPIRYTTIGAILLAFVVAAVVVGVAQALVRRVLEALDIVGAENREAVQARARQLTRALTLLAYGVAALAVLSLALNRFGVSEPQWDPRLLGRWFLTHAAHDRGLGARHEAEYWLDVVSLLGAHGPLRLEAPVSEDDRAAAARLLPDSGADAGKLLAIHPGTGWYGPGRRWPAGIVLKSLPMLPKSSKA